jgi:hypothetical protein
MQQPTMLDDIIHHVLGPFLIYQINDCQKVIILQYDISYQIFIECAVAVILKLLVLFGLARGC